MWNPSPMHPPAEPSTLSEESAEPAAGGSHNWEWPSIQSVSSLLCCNFNLCMKFSPRSQSAPTSADTKRSLSWCFGTRKDVDPVGFAVHVSDETSGSPPAVTIPDPPLSNTHLRRRRCDSPCFKPTRASPASVGVPGSMTRISERNTEHSPSGSEGLTTTLTTEELSNNEDWYLVESNSRRHMPPAHEQKDDRDLGDFELI